MTKLTDLIVDIVRSTYYEMNQEEAESARERGQRIRRAEERVIQEKPGYEKIIKKIKSQGDIEKYGKRNGVCKSIFTLNLKKWKRRKLRRNIESHGGLVIFNSYFPKQRKFLICMIWGLMRITGNP